MKKKVLYLHGLESNHGGEKVGYLADNCYVHAPKMDYTRKDIFAYLIQIMEDFEPDLIIGSSMGGYTAHVLSGLYDTLSDKGYNTHNQIEVEQVDGMGHRIPLENFINQVMNDL